LGYLVEDLLLPEVVCILGYKPWKRRVLPKPEFF